MSPDVAKVHRRPPFLAGVLLTAALLPLHAAAQTPIPVAVDSSSTVVHYRVTLVGREGEWASVPSAVAVEIAAPTGSPGSAAAIRNLHINASAINCPVFVSGAQAILVSLSNISVAAAPASVAMPAQLAPDGQAFTFASDAVPALATASMNYFATTLACNTLTAGGAPCSGPIVLAAPGSAASGSVNSGVLATNTGPRTISFVFFASFPLTTTGGWGTLDIRADLHGTLGASPICPADFNGVGGLSVQDIFDFLSAWFAGNPNADFNHVGGLSVQDIFDFLAAWFAGC